MTRNVIHSMRFWLVPAAMVLAMSATARAQDVFGGWSAGSCGSCETFTCQTHHCPPALAHCQEGAPKIRVKCGCPRPICNPCTQPGWGYYETCWSPWPWPPNYNHCATLPPAATVALTGPASQGPYYGAGGQQPIQQQPYNRPVPSTVNPSMPPVTAPPVQTTPGMPRIAPGGAMPQSNPIPPGYSPVPGGGLESLPVPRTDTPRPLPPGGNF